MDEDDAGILISDSLEWDYLIAESLDAPSAQAQRNRRLRESRKKHGRCTRCTKPCDRGHTVCPECRQASLDYFKTHRSVPGVCRQCKQPSGGFSRCMACRLTCAEVSRQWRAARREKGASLQSLHTAAT